MSAVVARLAAWLLARALLRWPEPQREELGRDWTAELHTLRHEPGVTAPVRFWRQLRFAGSLAVARPTRESASGRLGGVGSIEATVVSVILLALAPVGASAVAMVMVMGLWNQVGPVLRATPTLAVIGYLARAVVGALVGVMLARGALRRRPERPLGAAWVALAAVPLAVGTIAADIIVRAVSHVSGGDELAAVGALSLGLFMAPLGAGVAALRRRRHPWAAMGLGALGAPAIVFAATLMVVRHTPALPYGAERHPSWWLRWLLWIKPSSYADTPNADPRDLIESVLPVLPGVLLTTVMICLGYALRLSRPKPTAPARSVASLDAPAVVNQVWWLRTAWAAGGFALLAWAVTLAYLTPNIGLPTSEIAPIPQLWPGWNTFESRLWMHDLRLLAVACATLCLLLAAAHRGAPLLPALGLAAILVAADPMALNAGWATPRALPLLAAGALAVGYGAWWSSLRLGSLLRPGPHHRRLVVRVTVMAAFLAPGSYLYRDIRVAGVPLPPALLVVAAGLPAVLAVLVGLGLASLRPTPASTRPAWALTAALAVLAPVGGGALFLSGGQGEGITAGHLVATLAPPALSGLLVALTVAAIRSRRLASPPRLALWALAFLPLLAVGAVATYLSVCIGALLGLDLLHVIGYRLGFDGLPYVPGAMVVALVVASVGTAWLGKDRSTGRHRPGGPLSGRADHGAAPV